MDFTGFAHVALSVTDYERSKEWYERVLGWQPLFEGEEGGARYGVGFLPGGLILGFRHHSEGTGDPFSENRTGLDHVSFGANSRDELERWQSKFEDEDVAFSPIQDAPYGHVLNFRDPDNIALEIFCLPKG